jgi:hypothetical protein
LHSTRLFLANDYKKCKLLLGELRHFCELLFGSNPNSIPNPSTNWNWKDFMAYVEESLKSERLQWNPMTGKMAPWINLRVLQKVYGKGKCTIHHVKRVWHEAGFVFH